MKKILCVTMMVLIGVFASVSGAKAVSYDYTGNTYTFVIDSPLFSYTTSDYVSATLSFDNWLPADYSGDVSSLSGYSLLVSDSYNTFNSPTAYSVTTNIWTDGNGEITEWSIEIHERDWVSESGYLESGIITKNYDGYQEDYADYFVYIPPYYLYAERFASVSNSPGTWTRPPIDYWLGYDEGTNETYNLSSGSFSYDEEIIGYEGTGTFTQSGGTNTVVNDLTLASQSGSIGTYTLSGGTLDIEGNIVRGDGSSTFNIYGGTLTGASVDVYVDTFDVSDFTQTGGAQTTTTTLGVGNASGEISTFLLESGRVTADTVEIGVTGPESIGAVGTFTQQGGTNNVTGNLYITDMNVMDVGTYNLYGGTLDVGGNIFRGDGSSYFNIYGGALTGGSVNVSVDVFNVGLYGNSFTQTGGAETSTANLNVDGGTFTLESGSVSATNHEYIGNSDTGAFKQTGGTNTVTGNLYLGNNSGSSGTYTLEGGTLNVGGSIVNGAGTSTFNIDGLWEDWTVSGGKLDNLTVDYFGVGSASGSDGSFQLADSNTLTVNLNEFIGKEGTGSFTQSGGTHTVSNLLAFGYEAGSSGSYDLSGTGSLTAVYESIGDSGTGAFTQNGGTNTVYSTLSVGSTYGGSGTYDMTGGSLSVNDNEFIGHVGATGTFTQSGGTHTVTNNLYMGSVDGGNGSYNLIDGTLETGNLILGHILYSTGTFTQSGGTNTVTNDITLGVSADSIGTYTLEGGTLNVGGSIVSGAGTSTLNYNGGTLNADNISVDNFNVSGGAGEFNFTGGRFEVDNFGGDLNNAGGTVAPGSSPGTMTITGDYTQGADGELEIELGGLEQGVTYDLLAVSGTAYLDGLLTILMYDGYLPEVGYTTYDILTADTIEGEFASYSMPDLGSDYSFNVAYLTDPYATGIDIVQLQVSVVPEPISSTLFVVGGVALGFRRFRKKFKK